MVFDLLPKPEISTLMPMRGPLPAKARLQPIDSLLVLDWLQQAGDIALSHRHAPATEYKDNSTPVTAVDYKIENFLLDCIANYYPDHGVISEESAVFSQAREFTWVIDPLDGTRAFASGLPVWGISIGVLKDGAPHFGAFYMPALRELYWTGSEGVFCNDQPLIQRSVLSRKDKLAFLAVPSNAHHLYDIAFPRLRSLGSTAAHLLYVATGAAIGALTRRIKIWDIAGLWPILKHTGAVTVYLSGRPFQISDLLDGKSATEPLITAPAQLIEEIRADIRYKSR